MIHSSAIVHAGAEIDAGVEIGPYAVIGDRVKIAAGTTVGPHAVIEGPIEIGRDNRIFQFASIGAVPQDLKFRGEESVTIIGEGNTFREFVTVHRGTEDGGGETRIGSGNLFMAYTHVAHDCLVGDRTVLANAATLAGHVVVEDHAIIGGLSGIHQFARIGAHTMIAAGSMVVQDVPPFTTAQGDRAKTIGLNLVGLKRRGFSLDAVRDLKQAFKLVFRSKLRLEEALGRVEQELAECPEAMAFAEFIRNSERGIAR